MGRNRIQLTGINKSFYSKAAVTQALHKISLTFSEGEFVVITGESGSGKTTLLRILGGLETYDDGELYIDGEPTFRYDAADWENYRRSRVGYVFQDYSLIGHYSALDNIAGTLLIMGENRDTAYEKAGAYLREVGLEGLEKQRASELSSGQKQRLAIARALAKETGILLADEPTGNLDSENAAQIVKLLKELSRTRLVIMVTHNYDLVEGYATRRIRLHDGEVVSDTGSGLQTESGAEDLPVPSSANGDGDCGEQDSLSRGTSDMACRNYPVAAYFARLNRRTKRGSSLLFLIFFFLISTMSFLFIGELYAHADDTLTKTYDASAYLNEDDTRLAVRHTDGSELTEEDLEAIKAIPNVVTVDSCEYCNDINYYYKLGEDYKIGYVAAVSENATKERYVYHYIDDTHFMRSVSCIEESDLAAGRMAEGLTEIVLYSEDPSLLGTTVTIHFRAENLWSSQEWTSQEHCSYEMTIVGLLQEDTDQIYFSEEFGMMLGSFMDADIRYQLYYDFSGGAAKPYFQTLIPIVKEDLEGMQARIGGYGTSSDENEEEELFWSVTARLLEVDSHGELLFENITDLPLEKSVNLADNSEGFLEISAELFYTWYTPVCTQAAVYITNYARTDDVISRLEEMGYEAVSTWRVSATDYDEEKVNTRMTIIGISASGLFVLAIASLLILRSFMKIRRKDFAILKSMGMRIQMMRQISYFEMGAHCLMAMLLTVIVMWILRINGVEVLDIANMMWYIRWYAYVPFVLYNLTLCVLTVASFNRYLGRWMNNHE